MSKTGELALFFEIYNERPNICENEACPNEIHTFGEARHHHLATKGAHPELRLNADIIIQLCADCDTLAHAKGNSALKIPQEYKLAVEKYGSKL